MFVPKLELVEFLVYVGSTISLWFGFSLISLYDHFLQRFEQAKQKFKSPAMQTKIYNFNQYFNNTNNFNFNKLKRVINSRRHKTHTAVEMMQPTP